ncbi:(2Fe-2S)-binding protein [Pedococcus sp. 5OH_020]|uniref:(2Fe-2S)-binding protein n=1 Tax=Pedococcus sp. 5OH_020 TaxID=2989814 RepID=UPI0022EA0048|nr:(2Fe-2S)-binding protein [Pedococcus sp. 5OH_020]
MPAAFVLQWCLEVPATVGAYAALHGAWFVDPATCGLSFRTDPAGHYPAQVQLRSVEPGAPSSVQRLEENRAAYLEAARELALGYRPGVALGRRTRSAMVEDMWDGAVARATGAGPPPRGSCCFIYTLPGAHECAGCPRGGGPKGSSGGR